MKEANNTTKMNKTYIFAKVKQDDEDINNAIKEGFEDPLSYLQANSNVIVGKIYNFSFYFLIRAKNNFLKFNIFRKIISFI